MNFNQFQLDSRIMSGISQAGYATPTPVQTAAIPVILSGREIGRAHV